MQVNLSLQITCSHTHIIYDFQTPSCLCFNISSLAVITTNFLHQIATPCHIFHRFSSFYAIRTNVKCSTATLQKHIINPYLLKHKKENVISSQKIIRRLKEIKKNTLLSSRNQCCWHILKLNMRS